MAGLDETGKTKILNQLKPFVQTPNSPNNKTIGFHVENLIYKSVDLTVWSTGGKDKIRPLWRYYYEKANGLIFVVDNGDVDKFTEAKEQLWSLLSEVKLTKVSVLVFMTKEEETDGILNMEEVVTKLGLDLLIDRNWKINKLSDLFEGLDWLLVKR